MTFISLFSDEHGFVATNQRVFAPDELTPLNHVLEQAALLENQLSNQAETLQQAIDEARSLAHQQGLESGRAEAALELAEAHSQLHEQHLHTIQSVRASSAELAVEIVRKIAGDGDQVAWMIAQAEQAAQDLIDEPGVKLRVNPARVDDVKRRLQQCASSRLQLVVADERLAVSECVLETSQGQIDVSLETQLTSIIALFSEDLTRRAERND